MTNASSLDKELSPSDRRRAVQFARRRLRNALSHEAVLGKGTRGATEGWEGLTRRGSLETLLTSELLHDEDEFFRRQLDGEQLHLDRTSRSEEGEHIVLWNLDLSMLGAPRLWTVGFLLAITDLCQISSLWVNGVHTAELPREDAIDPWLDRPVSNSRTPWRSWLDTVRDLDPIRPILWIDGFPDPRARSNLEMFGDRRSLILGCVSAHGISISRRSPTATRWRRFPFCRLEAEGGR